MPTIANCASLQISQLSNPGSSPLASLPLRPNRLTARNIKLVEVLEATRNAWEAQNALIVAERDRTAAYLEATEKDLRQAVIDWCREHDTKKFDEHLSMRVIVKLEYEPDQATTWAKTNAPFILVADRKQFDALAKKQDFDFVNKVPSYSAVIASDLTTSNQQG